MKVPRLDLGLGDSHAQALATVLRSGMLIQGEQVARLEETIRARCERKHAIAVSSGTTALELALRALAVGPGDEVLCPALSWPSPAHAVLLRGATLRLVDVDEQTWNTTADAYASARTAQTKAAIVIDQFGSPADHDAIAKALPGVTIIEDAACALGSHYQNTPCGSFGAVSCLSFHPLKVLTTGEGGMCLTDDDDIAQELRALRNHGQSSPGSFIAPAGNARLSELHAALGNVHIQSLDARIARRLEVRERIARESPVRLQHVLAGCATNAQTLGVIFEGVNTAEARERALQTLRKHEIGVGPLSYALTEIGSLGPQYAASLCTNAEHIARVGIAIPCDASLSEQQVGHMISAIREAHDEVLA